MVSEREFESLVERCSGLPPSRDYSEDDYVTNLMLTVLDFQMQGRAVENALAGVSIQPLFDTLVLSAGQIEFEGQSEEAEREQTQTEVLPRLSQTAKGIRLHLRNTDRALRKTLTNLYRRANESLLEQGIHTLRSDSSNGTRLTIAVNPSGRLYFLSQCSSRGNAAGCSFWSRRASPRR